MLTSFVDVSENVVLKLGLEDIEILELKSVSQFQ
jgi:hypothetical protein